MWSGRTQGDDRMQHIEWRLFVKLRFAHAVEAATLGNFGCTVPRQAIEDLGLVALFALGMGFSQLV